MTTDLHHYTREDQRRELLGLGRGVASGAIRWELANEIVPLTASEFCPDAIGTFSDLVVAIGTSDGPEVTKQLNTLCGAA